MWITLLTACLPDLGHRSAAAFDGRCGDCHPNETAAFAGSRHAAAAASPVFAALRADAPDPGFCDGCHAPAGALDCLTCHAAAGHHGAENGQLIADPTGPIRGPRGADGAPHASMADGFLGDSELCGTCHDVVGSGVFHERPLLHWRGSAAADAGVSCADCHLDGHRFVGLQADPVGLLRRAIRLERGPDGWVLTNLAGHRLPDGAAWLRELWVEAGGRRVDLHPDVDGDDPFTATAAFRGVAPDGDLRLDLPAAEACVWFRPLAPRWAERVGQPTPAATRVVCVAP